MQLKNYRDENKIPAPELAKSIGVTPRALYQYESGKRIPERDTMVRIYKVTNGSVTANDFYISAIQPMRKRQVKRRSG